MLSFFYLIYLMDLIEFNVNLNRLTKKIIIYTSNKEDVLFKLKSKIVKEFKLTNSIKDLTLIVKLNTTKILTNNIIYKLSNENKPINLDLLVKQRGGLGIVMFGIIVMPIIIIGIAFSRGGDVLSDFIDLLINTFEILPLIFDPPRLIDDVLFAITSSIKIIFSKFSSDVTNLGSSPEDDTQESGPFGVSNTNRNAFTCMDPTWSTLLLLIICPPLAIIYKLGFAAGFISSIICGVLCVRLFYFPGLLFAILHVLC